MITETTQITNQLRKVINRIIFLEKKTLFDHDGIKLYPSELHLMQVVNAEEGINATAMAERLGITKGAVSQTLSRLEKKGVILKTKDPSYKNELAATFTDKGKAAMDLFRKHRAEAGKDFAAYLLSLSKPEQETVKCFLSEIESFLGKLG